jgi:hypothetical protein
MLGWGNVRMGEYYDGGMLWWMRECYDGGMLWLGNAMMENVMMGKCLDGECFGGGMEWWGNAKMGNVWIPDNKITM